MYWCHSQGTFVVRALMTLNRIGLAHTLVAWCTLLSGGRSRVGTCWHRSQGKIFSYLLMVLSRTDLDRTSVAICSSRHLNICQCRTFYNWKHLSYFFSHWSIYQQRILSICFSSCKSSVHIHNIARRRCRNSNCHSTTQLHNY